MLHGILRAATQDIHREIEGVVNFNKLTTSSLAYRDFLEKLYGFYLPIEQGLVAFGDQLGLYGIQIEERLKLNKLEQDISLFLSTNEISNLPICSSLPAINNVYQCMGILYVTEGATLGGQIIQRALLKSDKTLNSKKYFFHNGYGEKNELMWDQFKHSLSNISGQNDKVVVDSAVNTFKTLCDWIKNG